MSCGPPSAVPIPSVLFVGIDAIANAAASAARKFISLLGLVKRRGEFGRPLLRRNLISADGTSGQWGVGRRLALSVRIAS